MVLAVGCHGGGGGGAADAQVEVGSGSRAGTGTGTGEGEGGSAVSPVGGEWLEKMEVGGGVVYVAPPLGAVGKRPVVIAIHGAVDHPGLECSAWRVIVDLYAFVVCPGGTPVGADGPNRKYVWGSSEQIERRAMEALVAVEAKYPEHVVAGAPVVYAAFSQGATLAAPFLVRQGKRFPRAVLTEGGHSSFAPGAQAQAYAKAGGERVLFSCSQGGCARAFEQSRASLVRANVEARVVFAGAVGHSMVPAVRESLNDTLAWVVDGLPGWEGYAAAPKLPSH